MNALVADFDSISLPALNGRAALLERSDNKYVLHTAQLHALLAFARPRFDVLAVDGLRQFGYRSIYFDSAELHTFRQHNQGQRNRIKVRHRQYLDSGGCYFEVKLKGLRGKTHKYRLKITADQIVQPTLSAEEQAFLQCQHMLYYGRLWPYAMQRSITVDYRRITLIAKEGSERLTLDQHIEFFDGAQRDALPPDYWIVELKSASGRSQVNRWLLAQGIRPTSRCSKYAMGVSLLRAPHNNRFRPVLKRKFHLTPATAAA